LKTDHSFLCTVLVLNYNGLAFLQQFCIGWKKYLPDDTELVIADNASTDASLDYIKTKHPGVRIIKLDTNHGFAKGYNLAMSQIKTPYTILLNSDIETKSPWISPLIEMLQADENIAAVQPKIMDQKRPTYFEYAGAAGGFVDALCYPFCRGRIFQELEEDHNQYDGPKEIFWASGAAFAVRTKLFNQHGGFDADFFAHMEEIDLCWRLQRLGYSIYYQPQSKVYHVGGGTLSYASSRKTFLNFRNSLLMILKNEEKGKALGVIYKRMILDGFAGLSFLAKGQVGSFAAVFRAHIAFYGLLAKFRAKRKVLAKVFSTESNVKGRIDKSIVYQHYIKGIKKYTELK